MVFDQLPDEEDGQEEDEGQEKERQDLCEEDATRRDFIPCITSFDMDEEDGQEEDKEEGLAWMTEKFPGNAEEEVIPTL